MQADSVLTFTSASSLVEFVCEFLKYKCAAAIWFCAKHTHTHTLEKLHVQTGDLRFGFVLDTHTHTHPLEKLHRQAGDLRALLTLPPASQSLFVKISHTYTHVCRLQQHSYDVNHVLQRIH